MKIVQFIQEVGVLAVPIFIWGAFALALILEKWVMLRRAKKQVPLIHDVIAFLLEKDFDKAKDALTDQAETGIIAFLNLGIQEVKSRSPDIQTKMDESCMKCVNEYDKNLTTIQILGSLFPMIGLLGTVMGMISMFDALAIHGSGNVGVLAGGISEALITTEIGLISALPILFLHNYLVNLKGFVSNEQNFAISTFVDISKK